MQHKKYYASRIFKRQIFSNFQRQTNALPYAHFPAFPPHLKSPSMTSHLPIIDWGVKWELGVSASHGIRMLSTN